MTIKKMIIAAALAAPAMIAFAAPAQAQVAGIATADPTTAIARTKAFTAANEQIRTQFKDNLDKIQQRETERQRLLGLLDTNKDKQVDDNELASAQTAKNPALTQLGALETETNQLTAPVIRAQAFAIEMILQRYQEAQRGVITAKKISVILAPNAFVYYPDGADVTGAITTELDRLVPSVPITAPANWRPAEETLAVQQQIQRLTQYAMAAAAAQQRQAPAAGQPAAARPAGQPAAARPATQTPPPGR